MTEIAQLVEAFVQRIAAAIEAEAIAKARAQVLAAFGGEPVAKRRGRPPKALTTVSLPPVLKVRKRAPLQLCPVPGCKNPAAPIFGMVCSTHKDLPKAKIKKYRDARKLAKLEAAGKAAAPKAKKATKNNRPKTRRAVAKKGNAKRSRLPAAVAKKAKRQAGRSKGRRAKSAPPPAPPSGTAPSPSTASSAA